MKLLASILSIYILVLTAIPCVDVCNDHSLNKAELSQTKTDNNHNDFDRCSPFCTCDCCTSRVFPKDHVIRFISCPMIEKWLTEYSSSYISSDFTSIWHPPKIG